MRAARFALSFLLLVSTTLTGCGDDAAPPATAGLERLEFADETRDRTIPVDLWYPTGESSPDLLALAGIFLARGTQDAPLLVAAPRPLILLSHGSGGGRADQAWLAQRLAAAGFLVAAVEHPGNRFGNNSPEGVVAVWRRPPDLSFVLGALLRDSHWGPAIDASRVGAAGHSSGGYTVIAIAGARYDFGLLGAYCVGPDAGPDCSLASDVDLAGIADLAEAGWSYRDERVRAVFAMAPAVGQAFDERGLSSVQTPVHIVGSRDDELTRFELNAGHYASALPAAELTVVHPGGHFVYMSPCNDLGREVATLVCVDPDPATARQQVHEQIAAQAVRFFRRELN